MVCVFGKQLQILNSIVGLVLVLVMNHFPSGQRPSKEVRHHQSVLWNVGPRRAASIRMAWAIHQDVTIFINQTATSPLAIPLCWKRSREISISVVPFQEWTDVTLTRSDRTTYLFY
jgi:hypothetical protein